MSDTLPRFSAVGTFIRLLDEAVRQTWGLECERGVTVALTSDPSVPDDASSLEELVWHEEERVARDPRRGLARVAHDDHHMLIAAYRRCE